LAVSFAADITNMALDNLAVDPAILNFGKIDAALTFYLADEDASLSASGEKQPYIWSVSSGSCHLD
jgi:hypothetical protein